MLLGMTSRVRICRCPEPLRLAALRMVLRELPEASQAAVLESMVDAHPSLLGPFDGLFVAMEDDQLVGAVWSQPQAGGAASFWLPQVDDDLADDDEIRLIAQAIGAADNAGVEVVQGLLEPNDRRGALLLCGSGFQRIAVLKYLEWRTGPLPASVAFPDGVTIRRAPTNSARLEAFVSATYEGSLDCPAITGMRSMPKVLEGYRAAGQYDPELWLSVERCGINMGVLLLADHPNSDQVELIYMGLRPEARGRGIGSHMVRHAQNVTRRLGRGRLVLAADAANDKALAVYAAAGFAEWAQRVAMLRPLSGGKKSSSAANIR